MEKKYRENQYKFWQELLNLGNQPKRKKSSSTGLIDRYVNADTFVTGVDVDIFNKAYEGSKKARKSKAKTRTIIIVVIVLLIISAGGFYFGNMYIQEKARAEEESQRISMQETIQASFEKTEIAIALATAENVYEATIETTDDTDINNENESDSADNIDVTPMPDAAEIADETTLDQGVSTVTEPGEESIVEVQTTPLPMDHWLSGEPFIVNGKCGINGLCNWVSYDLGSNAIYAVYLPVPESESLGRTISSFDVLTQNSLNVNHTYAINECDLDYCFIGLYSPNDIGKFSFRATLGYDIPLTTPENIDLLVFPVSTHQYIEPKKHLVKEVLQIVKPDEGDYLLQTDEQLLAKVVPSYSLSKLDTLVIDNGHFYKLNLYIAIPSENNHGLFFILEKMTIFDNSRWNFPSSISELPAGSYFILTSSEPIDLSGTYLIVTTTN